MMMQMRASLKMHGKPWKQLCQERQLKMHEKLWMQLCPLRLQEKLLLALWMQEQRARA
jgi:hypothetical protein